MNSDIVRLCDEYEIKNNEQNNDGGLVSLPKELCSFWLELFQKDALNVRDLMISSELSDSYTLAHVIQVLNLDENDLEMPVIDVIGASDEEYQRRHLMCNIGEEALELHRKTLRLRFYTTEDIVHDENEAQSQRHELHRSLYHCGANLSTKPLLAIAFNAGMSPNGVIGEKWWRPTVERCIKNRVPFACTSMDEVDHSLAVRFLEEITADSDVVVDDLGSNSRQSLRPGSLEGREETFSRNRYCVIVR